MQTDEQPNTTKALDPEKLVVLSQSIQAAWEELKAIPQELIGIYPSANALKRILEFLSDQELIDSASTELAATTNESVLTCNLAQMEEVEADYRRFKTSFDAIANNMDYYVTKVGQDVLRRQQESQSEKQHSPKNK